MGQKAKLLTHDEIWDDSGLVKSWNDALEEYKLYHSIHAKGERVEDVIDAYEVNANANDRIGNPTNIAHVHDDPVAPALEEDLEDGEWDEKAEEDQMVEEADGNAIEDVHATTEAPTVPPSSDGAQGTAVPAPVPMAMMGNVQDDALKNLMMSWYWAGYYTGLHQGQQQSATQTANQT